MSSDLTKLAGALFMAAGALSAVAPGARADDELDKMEMHMQMASPVGADAHAHHHHMAPKVSVMTAEYIVPQITLVRDDGKSVSLPDEMNDGRPVILTFIYTSCTEVCPVTSHTFEQLQSKLGSDRDKVHLISITIDPEQDTPSRLAEYARKYNAGPAWNYYTGTSAASIAAQQAFDVYRGDKMNHTPVAFLRAARGKSWLRVDGFASADELLKDYRTLVATTQ